MRAIDDLTVTNLSDAVDEASGFPRKLLPPSDVLAAAIGAHSTDFAETVHTQITGEWQPSRELTVGASKARHGVRPIAVWDPVSQVTYDALAARIRPALPPLVRSGEAWRAFLRGPVDHRPKAKYVVAADIASCYQFIDHGILAAELTERSNDRSAVQSIIELLRATSDRRYGLPQQSRSSDTLAEPYLAKLERGIVRKGLTVSRYNDDFRFVCDSWTEVNRAIEVLSDEARALGLTPNDSKIITWKRSSYKESLDEADALRESIAGDVDFLYDEYDDEVEVDEDEADTQAALELLNLWRRIAGKGKIAEADKATHRSLLELLPRALGSLTSNAVDDEDAVEIAMMMLRVEQTLTPHVCRYLTAVPTKDKVLTAFDAHLKDDGYLTDWQAWWLQVPFREIADFAADDRRKEWLEAINAAEHAPLLRAETAFTLATLSPASITTEKLLTLYDRSSRVERPMVVAALAKASVSSSIRNAVISDSLLHQWIFDEVESA